MRKMIKTQSKRWDKLDIERLKRYRRNYGNNISAIARKFPDRSYDSVRAAIGNLERRLGHKNDGVFYRKPGKLNPNPPTMLTYILVHNYYDEDINRGMTKADAIADISLTLNRSQEWVKQALKTDVRKYVEKDEEKENE